MAGKTGRIQPQQLSQVIVDATLQPKNAMFPTDAMLLNRAPEILVQLSKKHGVKLRQSYARVGKFALIQHPRHAHARQFKRANRGEPFLASRARNRARGRRQPRRGAVCSERGPDGRTSRGLGALGGLPVVRCAPPVLA